MLLKPIFAVIFACLLTMIMAADKSKNKNKNPKPQDPCYNLCTPYWVCVGIDSANGAESTDCVYPPNCDCLKFETITKE